MIRLPAQPAKLISNWAQSSPCFTFARRFPEDVMTEISLIPMAVATIAREVS